MGFRIDLHLHTSRYSACSRLPADKLIKQGIKVGLQGIVITEHHHIWDNEELDELKELAGEPSFTLLAGFEYSSTQGDILVYGLTSGDVEDLPRRLEPEEIVEKIRSRGGACIAAHPTREGLSFDERITSLRLNAIEVKSVNMANHEQRLALRLAQAANLNPTAASDAHRLQDIGAYATDFEDPIITMKDLIDALQSGRFRTV